jgi:putative ABC transport system permease protein
VRRILSAEAPDVAITSVATADEHLSLALMPQRAGSAALGLFGLLGLALASLGVYGVTSYTVERRSHEIGVRLALGAGRGDVVRMIVGKGMIVAFVGAAVGLTAAAGLSQLLGFLLFGIEPLDGISFLAAGAIVAVACLLANWLPAHRSARLSPASILKGD